MRSRPVMPRAVGAIPARGEGADAAGGTDGTDDSDESSEPAEPAALETAPPTDAVPVIAEDDPDEPSSLEAPVPLDQPPGARRALTRRGVLVVGGRALAGAGALAVAAALVIGATALPEPRYSVTPPRVTVSPISAAQQRVCPGPLLRLGDDQGQGATSATSIGRATAQSQGAPGSLEAEQLEQTDNASGLAPLVLTLPPDDDGTRRSAAIAGSQSQVAASGELVGLASAQCAEPSGDTWLVGGSTDVGRTTLITLSNPTTVIAEVQIDVFGPAGEVVAPGTDGIVVPPGAQRILSLAGFAPQLVAPVIRVQSRGGLIVANLQQSIIRTLQPGGVDIVGASDSPAREVVIPGVAVSTSAAIAAAQQDAGFEDLQTAVRMFVPGETAATATVSILPEAGSTGAVDDAALEAVPGASASPAGFQVDLPAGQVTELAVPGLADGAYTIGIDSDVPIVAAARVSTLTDGGASDFAWIAAALPLPPTALVSVAPGPSPVLHLANPTGETRSIEVSGEGGSSTVEVAAGTAASTAVEAGADVTLAGAEGIRAAVTYSAPGRTAAFGIAAPGPAAGDIVVYR